MRAVVLFVAVAGALSSGPPAGAALPLRRATGRVVDPAGHPQVNVIVFVAAAGAGRIVAMASSDGDGRVELALPQERHDFGVLSATLGVRKLLSRGPGRFELVVVPLQAAGPSLTPDAPAVPITSPHAVVVRGRVLDQTGAGLEGVQLDVVRDSGAVISRVFSGAGGAFALAVPAGQSRLRATAPGLAFLGSRQQPDGVVITMTVAAEPQRITITSGRVLQFRVTDSIDPEYTPPAVVRAWLRYAYGICPSAILTASEKRALRKYWYLDVLRRAPPNPASISTATCNDPTAYQPTTLPPGTVGGFDIWREGVLGQP